MADLRVFASMRDNVVTSKNRTVSFDMPELSPPSFPERIIDISDCGARGDGQTLNTEAFGKAIKTCAEQGGGTVRVPAGSWLTGAIHLLSNVRLHLERDATVLFSTQPEHYLPVVFTRWEGVECYNYSPLIYAKDCTNIAVTGQGVFDGQGANWWGWKKPRQEHRAVQLLYNCEHEGIPVEQRVFGREEDALRPQFIQPINCRNVLIEGITFKNGPMWTIHPVYCQNVIIRGVTVDTKGPNTDGLNPDSCRNILIENCRFSTGDDCIAINSGTNEDGWRVNKPCENIVIRHCRMDRGHGGVVIGSAMSGGVRNLYAHDCNCEGISIGIRMKSMRGRGGIVENMYFDNFRMSDIRYDAVRITSLYSVVKVPPTSSKPPVFRNIRISNVSCEAADRAVELQGLPEQPLQNLVFEDVRISAKQGITCDCVDGLTLKNVTLNVQKEPALNLSSVEHLQTAGVETTVRSTE